MSRIDEIYQKIQDNTDIMEKNKEKSEIVKHFQRLSVFFTGSTDLLGICLLEKLLRSCLRLDKVYLLIKTKDGENFKKKCNKLYEDNIFKILRKNNSNSKNKIKPLKGDLMQDKFGLNYEDYKILTENIYIIFHNRSTSKFNEKIIISLQTNVFGTQRMLDLTHNYRYLKAFVLISSCSSHNDHVVIKDKFYKAPTDLNLINDMIVAEIQTGISEESLRMLIGNKE